MTQEKFIEAVVQGNERARRALYERYKVKLFMVCLRYGRDRAEAEDMLQEGFIVIYKDIKQYSGKGNLEGWLRRVVVNTALRYLRKWKNPFVAMDEQLEVADYKEDTSYDAPLNVQQLTKMIQELPVGYRTVFNMYVMDSYTHKEIASYLNINAGTSKSQLAKARKMLRQKVEEHLASDTIKR